MRWDVNACVWFKGKATILRHAREQGIVLEGSHDRRKILSIICIIQRRMILLD
jgi:hypothetical protein